MVAFWQTAKNHWFIHLIQLTLKRDLKLCRKTGVNMYLCIFFFKKQVINSFHSILKTFWSGLMTKFPISLHCIRFTWVFPDFQEIRSSVTYRKVLQSDKTSRSLSSIFHSFLFYFILHCLRDIFIFSLFYWFVYFNFPELNESAFKLLSKCYFKTKPIPFFSYKKVGLVWKAE